MGGGTGQLQHPLATHSPTAGLATLGPSCHRFHNTRSYSRPRALLRGSQKQASCIVHSTLPHEKQLCPWVSAAILDVMGWKSTRSWYRQLRESAKSSEGEVDWRIVSPTSLLSSGTIH